MNSIKFLIGLFSVGAIYSEVKVLESSSDSAKFTFPLEVMYKAQRYSVASRDELRNSFTLFSDETAKAVEFYMVIC